jgi:hypothetical protein
MDAAPMEKCTMTGCGKPVSRAVTLSIPSAVADAGGDVTMNKGALADVASFPACGDHADHVAKVFYGAAYALSGTVTTSDRSS